MFWLHLDEAHDALVSSTAMPEKDLKQLVRQRRAEYKKESRRRLIPRVVTSAGETFYDAPPSDASAPGRWEARLTVAESPVSRLTGTPACPGIYEGTARVILDPVGAELAAGEILVAPGTDPAWTPLFLSAGALVTETGGSMSHGSVVAREYGIPAVVGVPQATKLVVNGQRIRVDGWSGFVILLE